MGTPSRRARRVYIVGEGESRWRSCERRVDILVPSLRNPYQNQKEGERVTPVRFRVAVTTYPSNPAEVRREAPVRDMYRGQGRLGVRLRQRASTVTGYISSALRRWSAVRARPRSCTPSRCPFSHIDTSTCQAKPNPIHLWRYGGNDPRIACPASVRR